jgi:vitamin B12/bleomycin/antimicrobial peptide transport system ATP-binding/permease protein
VTSAGERTVPVRDAWRRWRNAVGTFVSSDAGGPAKWMSAALLVLLLAINGLNVVNSYVGRDFFTAIEARSLSAFVTKGLLYIGVFLASTAAAVLYSFTEQRLGLHWREWLTRRLIGRYLRADTYYWLREHPELSNPDQRIADDVRVFTASTLSLALILLNTTFTILAFSGVLWTISPELFIAAVVYAAAGSAVTILFGRPLIGLNYDQSDREATLRAELVHLRESGESVALQHLEDHVAARLARRVTELVANSRRIIAVNRNVGFFTTSYNYMIQIIPVLIVAPLFIRGKVEFGVITQSSMAFAHVVGAFSVVISQFQQISSYAVVMRRLTGLSATFEEVASQNACGIVYDDTGTGLAWERVTLRDPGEKEPLVDALSGSVPPGTRLLVTAKRDACPAALFRATAGVWRGGEGRIVRPPPDAILFLPERPYVAVGTLRAALAANGGEPALDDARIQAVLGELGADSLLRRAGGLDVERDWDDVLSLGEQQTLALARVLLAAPRFVVLDRPTTLLGPEAGGRALDLLAARSITAITFAADGSLAERHDTRLEIGDHGTWTLRPIERKGGPG